MLARVTAYPCAPVALPAGRDLKQYVRMVLVCPLMLQCAVGHHLMYQTKE